MAMKYFCFYHDYLDKFDMLDDAEAGRLTKALLRYAASGEIMELSRVEMACFTFIKSNIDREREQYDLKCERNRKNINKRYQKSTTVYDRMQEEDKEEDKEEYKQKDEDNNEEKYKDENKDNNKYEYEHEDKDEEKEEDEEEDKEDDSVFIPPTRLDVRNFCRESGCEADEEMIDMFLEHYDAMDWKVRSGKVMKNWKLALTKWVDRQKRYDSGHT